MADSFEVLVPALQSHARTLRRLSDELSAALDAAGSASITAEAYSQKGRGFAAALQALAGIGRDTLKSGVEALQAASTTMTETVTAYQRRDEASAERLNAIIEVDGPPSS